ncbi:MAG: hypothetical protein WAV93_03610 [Bacteroidales bacterium]
MAQDGAERPSKIEARAAWDNGNYELALEHYNGLLLLFSRDPLYKHYAGVCLVKMERDIPRAVTLLGSAINSSVNVKSVPDDVWFYYGRALQMSGSFTEAREAFERFSRMEGRKVAAEYEVQSYIDQCSRGQGSMAGEAVAGTPKTHPAEAAERSKVPSAETKPSLTEAAAGSRITTAAGKPEPAATAEKQQVPVNVGKHIPAAAVGKQQLPHAAGKPDPSVAVSKSPLPPASDLPAEYEFLLAEAVRLQHESDSILQATGDTARAASMQFRADSLFMTLEAPSDSDPVKTPPDKPEAEQPARLFSDFEVRLSPAYSEKNPVPVEFTIPPGLIYTVQIAAFRNPVLPSLFRGLYPVFGGKRAGSDAIYYYTGLFRRLEDARQALPGARSAGFTDAFIVAFMDGTQVSMERAGLLEREWSLKPLPVKEPAPSTGSSTGYDPTTPVGTLSFRAEAMRVSKPVKPEVIEKVELLAGARGLNMIKNSSGETVFLIGNFITFESAAEYVSLLIRNGYSNARVAAYVGLQEIPVEAAKELINRLQDD